MSWGGGNSPTIYKHDPMVGHPDVVATWGPLDRGRDGGSGGGAAVRQTVPLSLDGMNLPLRTGNIDRGPGQYALVEVMEAACIDNRDKRYKKL